MLLIETELGNTTNRLSDKSLREPETGRDYWDDSYEYKQDGMEDSDEDDLYDDVYPNEYNQNNDLYDDVDTSQYDYYPNEVDREPKKLSASTCRPRRGMGNDVSLHVTCGDRVIIDCDRPQFGSCISRFFQTKIFNYRGRYLNLFSGLRRLHGIVTFLRSQIVNI